MDQIRLPIHSYRFCSGQSYMYEKYVDSYGKLLEDREGDGNGGNLPK